MADDTECPLAVKWPNRGYDQCPREILSFSIDSHFLTSTDAFQLEVYDDQPRRLEDLLWEPIELAVDGATQLIGRVEQARQGHAGQYTVELRGRDYIADLVEGNVDPAVQITKDMALVAALKLALGPYGITSVVGGDDVELAKVLTGIEVRGRKKSSKSVSAFKLDDLKPDFGQGAYDWANKIVAHHGLTIQPSTKRTELRLAEPCWSQEPIGSAWRTGGASPRGNVLEAERNQDGSRTPSSVLAKGEQCQAGQSAKPLLANAGGYDVTAFREMGQRAAITERRIPGKCQPIEFGKLYRLLTFEDKLAKTPEQLSRGLWRALSERIKDLMVYTCTLRGYRDEQTRAIYTVDTTLDVQDDWANVHESMWIAGRRITWGRGQGATTNLTAWRPGAIEL